MKSIERVYNRTINNRPGLSSYIAYASVIDGSGYGKPLIRKYFNKLVDKDDYLPSEREGLLNHLYELSVPS